MNIKLTTMRILLKLTALALMSAIIIIACQKGVSDKNSSTTLDAAFTVATVKTWYMKTYQKTEEWTTAWSHGKKFPDWKNGIYYENSDQDSGKHYEFLEAPLLKQKSRFLVPSDNSLTTTQKQQIVAASLSRVVFIRKDNHDVFIREVNYVPDWQYLQTKNFDISKTCYGKVSDDFTGIMIIKDWDENILSMRILKDGKIIKRVSTKRVSANSGNQSHQRTSEWTCTWLEYCMWYQDCKVMGDAWTDDCGEPYMDPNDCYLQEECAYQEDDPCVLYGIGCDGGGNPTPDQCSEFTTNFNQLTGTVQSQKESIDQLYNDGITKQLIYKWKVYTVSGGSFVPCYLKSKEKAILENNGGLWQYRSLEHLEIYKEGATIAYDVAVENVTALPELLSRNNIPKQASKMTLDFTVKWSAVCNGFPLSYSENTSTNQTWYVSE